VISVRGIKEIDAITVLLVLAISAVFVMIGVGRGFQPGAFQPLAPKGLPGVFAATTYSFVMFIGARSTVAAAARIKEPGKNVPRAILFSSILIVILYCLMAYVTIGLTPKADLLNPDFPFLTEAAKVIMGDVGGALITIAGMFAAITSLTTSMMVQSSIVRGLSRDGYFPKFLLRKHKRFGTNHMAIIVSSIFLILFAATGVIQFVGYVAGFASMVGFALVNLTLIKLRKEKPLLKRPFKAPLYPFAPIIGIIMSIILLVFVEGSAFILGIEFIILAVIVYYLRMSGYHRLRVAIGGINLGIGSFTLLLLLLIQTGLAPIKIPQGLATPVFYGLIFLSITQFLAAVLNITSKS
jgi:amino acid transporter